MAREMVARAKQYCDDVEFSPMDATRADVELRVPRCSQIAIDAGATSINIPDTVGYAIPEEFASSCATSTRTCPNMRKVAHLRALPQRPRAGRGELSRGGPGRRAPDRDARSTASASARATPRWKRVVMALRTRGDFFDLGHRHRHHQIHRTSRLVSQLTGIAVQPNKAIVGVNAFRAPVGHPPGRRDEDARDLRDHRRGDIGLARATTSCWASTPAATRCARRWRSSATAVDGQALRVAFDRFKELADKKKHVTAMDLEALVTDELRDEISGYALEWFDVDASSRRPPHATRVGDAARRLERPGVVHGGRAGRCDLPRDQHRDGRRCAAAGVPRRRGDRRAGRARRGVGRARARRPQCVGAGRGDGHPAGVGRGVHARAHGGRAPHAHGRRAGARRRAGRARLPRP